MDTKILNVSSRVMTLWHRYNPLYKLIVHSLGAVSSDVFFATVPAPVPTALVLCVCLSVAGSFLLTIISGRSTLTQYSSVYLRC